MRALHSPTLWTLPVALCALVSVAHATPQAQAAPKARTWPPQVK